MRQLTEWRAPPRIDPFDRYPFANSHQKRVAQLHHMFELNDGAFLVDQYIPFCSPLAIHPRWPHWSFSQKPSLVFVQLHAHSVLFASTCSGSISKWSDYKPCRMASNHHIPASSWVLQLWNVMSRISSKAMDGWLSHEASSVDRVDPLVKETSLSPAP